MSKKHFEQAAQIVRSLSPRGLKAQRIAADAFVELFSAYNPRFDRARFLAVCGLEAS